MVCERRMMHDVVIIGGGHNGLVCSAYLATAGSRRATSNERDNARHIRGAWLGDLDSNQD